MSILCQYFVNKMELKVVRNYLIIYSLQGSTKNTKLMLSVILIN